jgi:hypothetical protein
MVRYLPFVHDSGGMPADASMLSIMMNRPADILLYHEVEAAEIIIRADLSGQGPRFIRCKKDRKPAACSGGFNRPLCLGRENGPVTDLRR